MSANNDYDDAVALEQKLSDQKNGDPAMPGETWAGDTLDVVLDPKKERKLLAKLDLAFVPIIMLTYLSCFLDRSNIGRFLRSPNVGIQTHQTYR